MIDFIKLQSRDENIHLEKLLVDSQVVNAIGAFNYGTGELCYPIKANFQNMEARVTEHYATVKNSVHKYYNWKKGEGNRNHNDFSYLDFRIAIMALEKEIGLKLDDFAITNLEFGLNIPTFFSPKSIIEQNMVLYDFKDFNQNTTFNGKGVYKQFNRSEYALKVYDKGLQYKLEENILRIELKITDSKFLKRLGINLLKDLYDKSNFDKLFNKLLEVFDKLVIVDLYSVREITDETKSYINMGKSPSYWRELTHSCSRTKAFMLKKKYLKLINDLGYDSIKNEIKEAMLWKYNDLMKDDFYSFPTLREQIRDIICIGNVNTKPSLN